MNKKYKYLVVLQQNWGYGWDDIITYDDTKAGRKECGFDYKIYLKEEPNVPLRIIHRRVAIN